MIPGFNTDIEHGGVTYHVQTEDKGTDAPVILSLVYHGGAILASKRTPYNDLLTAGLDEATLVGRLQRQHKLICAAIRSGRIEDLKRMNDRPAAQTPPESSPIESPHERQPAPTGARSIAHLVKNGIADFARRTDAPDAPQLVLLDEPELRAGREVALRVKLTQGDAVLPAAATITARALGTAFREVSCAAQTDGDGVASLRLALPSFASGRAVLLIAANVNGHEVTLRRVVQPD